MSAGDIAAAIASALGGAAVGGAIGTGLMGLLGKLFGFGGGLPDIPDSILEGIEDTRDKILSKGAVRYDKAQTLTDAQKTQARNNIGAISAADLPSRGSLLEGTIRHDVIQSDDALSTFITDEEANQARDNLRLNGNFINFTLTQEQLLQLITVEQAAAVRAALRIENARNVHVRQVLLEQHNHFTYVKKSVVSNTTRHLANVERHDHFTNVWRQVRHTHNTLHTETNSLTRVQRATP